MKKLEDMDEMPFGKHRGILMRDVPASYLHYLWITGKESDKQCPVTNYIRRNLMALKIEHPDGVW